MKATKKILQITLLSFIISSITSYPGDIFGQQVLVTGKIERLLPSAAYNNGCLDLEVDDMFSTNFKVTFIDVNTQNEYYQFTDNNGHYSIWLEEGTYDIYPEICPEDTYYWGINVLDISVIRRHFLGITPIACPLLRIAADVNDDLEVDTFDIQPLRDLMVGISDTFEAPNWRFLAIDYIKPYAPPWDCCFVRNFWEFPALPNEKHPFQLIYERDPFYLISDHHQINSWTDKYFRFNVYDGCNPRVPDFIALKTGNIASAATYPYPGGGIACFVGTLHDTSSAVSIAPPEEIQITDDLEYEISRNNDTVVVEVNVFLEGVDSLLGYQFGLRIPEEWIHKINIKKLEEGIELSQNNFNLNQEFLKRGHLNHLWLSDADPINALNGIFLFSMELHLIPDEFLDINTIISFDNKRIPLKFIGYSDGVVSVVEGNIFFSLEE